MGSILAEPSAQHALDTLLALTASAEPLGVSEVDATGEPKHPMREVVLDDHDTFPSLVDADGWQCVSGAKLQEMEKDPGSTWCDRASAAKVKPAPKSKAAPVTWVRKKRPGQQKGEEELEQACLAVELAMTLEIVPKKTRKSSTHPMCERWCRDEHVTVFAGGWQMMADLPLLWCSTALR